jgi:hypothetical protein
MEYLMRVLSVCLVFSLATALATAPAARAQTGALAAELSGAESVGNAGAPADAKGSAAFTLRRDSLQICYTLKVTGIAAPTLAHIHRGPKGQNGAIVVTLETPFGGFSEGCTRVDEALFLQIAASPSDFYVQVHNIDFPRGAMRGQLHPPR